MKTHSSFILFFMGPIKKTKEILDIDKKNGKNYKDPLLLTNVI